MSANLSTRRTSATRYDADRFPAMAEKVVVAWVQMEVPAPAPVRDILKEYRILSAQIEHGSDSETLYDRSNTLYDQLVAAAAEKCRVSEQASKQLRRIQKRDHDRLSWSQKCAAEIARWDAQRGGSHA